MDMFYLFINVEIKHYFHTHRRYTGIVILTNYKSMTHQLNIRKSTTKTFHLYSPFDLLLNLLLYLSSNHYQFFVKVFQSSSIE